MSQPTTLPNLHLVFHHLGLAVRKPTEAMKYLSAFGYRLGSAVLDPGQNVNLMMCNHESEPDVEIIWPTDTKGPLDALTQKHTSGIVYHVCYSTENLAAALSGLKNAGLHAICISPPKPAPLFNGQSVSFYNVVGIGLIEILEK